MARANLQFTSKTQRVFGRDLMAQAGVQLVKKNEGLMGRITKTRFPFTFLRNNNGSVDQAFFQREKNIGRRTRLKFTCYVNVSSMMKLFIWILWFRHYL